MQGAGERMAGGRRAGVPRVCPARAPCRRSSDYLRLHRRDVVCGRVTQCGDVMTRAGWHTIVMWHPSKGRAGIACCDDAVVAGALWWPWLVEVGGD